MICSFISLRLNGSKVSSNTLVLSVYVAPGTRPLVMACKRLLLRDGIKKCHLSTPPLERSRLHSMTSLTFYTFPSEGELLDHSRIKHDESLEIMVIYLGVDPMDALMQCESTIGAHTKFSYLKKLYGENLELIEDANENDIQVTYHQECALRCYLIFSVGTTMFVDKSATYIDCALAHSILTDA